MTQLTLEQVRKLRQSRKFSGDPVEADMLRTILEIARWTGSSRNGQPWHMVVVDDREQLKRLAAVRELNAWLENAGFAIAIATDNSSPKSEPYDVGRMTERIMLTAEAFGLGSATAWYTKDEEISNAKTILGLPEEMSLFSMVVVGHVSDDLSDRGQGSGGRRPLNEIVSFNRYGNHER